MHYDVAESATSKPQRTNETKPPGACAGRNKLALKHGTYSPIIITAKADELRPTVTSAAPWTTAPEFAGTLELYCRTLATALLGLEHIANVAETQGYGKVPPRLIETVNAMTNTALRAGTLLGLDPRAKAQIMALSASTESSLAALDRLTNEAGAPLIAKRKAELALLKDNDETPRINKAPRSHGRLRNL